MKTHLKIGAQAPKFDLEGSDGNRHTNKDCLGKKLLIFFYPRDNTPGCTTEACNFAEGYEAYQSRNVAILGVSTNSLKSHRNFSKKYGFPYPLLADVDSEMSKAFGALKSLEPLLIVSRRVSFLIDESGKIEQIWDPVKAKIHHDEVLAYLNES